MSKTRYWDRCQEGEMEIAIYVMGLVAGCTFLVILFKLASL